MKALAWCWLVGIALAAMLACIRDAHTREFTSIIVIIVVTGVAVVKVLEDKL